MTMTWDEALALLARIREEGWEVAGWQGQGYHLLPVGPQEQKVILTLRRMR